MKLPHVLTFSYKSTNYSPGTRNVKSLALVPAAVVVVRPWNSTCEGDSGCSWHRADSCRL